MAYDPNLEDEKEEQPSGSGQPSVLGAGRQSAGPSRTSFVNTSEYLTKNPDEGENLVSRLETSLGSERDEAASAASDAYSQFGDRVQEGAKEYDSDFVSGALSNPETFTQDADNVARFHALRDAAYGGPSSFQETDLFAPVQSKISALKSKGESLGTESGRAAVLNPLSERPSAGKTALNQLILQGTPDAAGRLQSVANTFPAVEEQWNQYLQQAPQQVQTAKASTDAARAQTRDALSGATSQFQTGLQGKLQSATQERDAFNKQYSDLLAKVQDPRSGPLTAAERQLMGLPEEAGGYLEKLNAFNQPEALGSAYYNSPVQLQNYLQGGRAATNLPDLGSVAGNADYAREAALQQLSGMDLGLSDETRPTTPYSLNGQMPGLDYMGAFNTAGSRLRSLDQGFTVPGADPQAQSFALNSVQPRLANPAYYTDPAAQVDTPVQQPDPGTYWGDGPYPQPTSPMPAAGWKWDTYQGTWVPFGAI